jgi:EAL and modified HD-GYP domain-containing signal transduction protein
VRQRLRGRRVLAAGRDAGPFLELTRACESGDDEGFARAANALQLSNHQVNWAHLQALAWADNLTADDPTA